MKTTIGNSAICRCRAGEALRTGQGMQPGEFPAPKSSPPLQEALLPNSAHNARVIQDFKAHWENGKDSREIEALFAKAGPETDPKRKSHAAWKAGSP